MRLYRPDLIINVPERTAKKTRKAVIKRSLIAIGIAALISVLIS